MMYKLLLLFFRAAQYDQWGEDAGRSDNKLLLSRWSNVIVYVAPHIKILLIINYMHLISDRQG